MEVPAAFILTGLGLLGAVATWLVSQPARIAKDLREQLEREFQDRRTAQSRCRDLELELATCHTERAHFKEASQQLSRAAAMVGRAAGAAAVFDYATDGWICSTSKGEGRILWANKTLLAALGYSSEEFLALDWRQLINPRDLPRAEEVEASAHGNAVNEFTCRYRRHGRIGGGWQWLTFHCPQYEEGVTYCCVLLKGIEGATQAD